MSKPRGMPTAELLHELEQKTASLGLGPAPTPATVVIEEPAELEPEEAELAELEQRKIEPKEKRRKLPKNRTGTRDRPYPGLKRDTCKVAFNLDRKSTKQLDAFFGELGPGKRNLWAERVLLAAMRRTRKRWAASEEGEG